MHESSVSFALRRRQRLTQENLQQALTKAGGHRAQAAELLGISERTLYRHLQRMGLD